jgi:hypothetical protein
VEWIDLAQDRDQLNALVNTVMSLQVSENNGKFLSNCRTGSHWKRVQLFGVSWLVS